MSTTVENTSDDLSKMTPRQQVSNRSILRIQQLSDEFGESLNRMDLFQKKQLGKVGEVLFVAIDHRRSNNKDTWYNFRLCATYGLDDEALKHVKEHGSNWEGVEALFRLAKSEWDPHTSASRQKFLGSLGKELEEPNNTRREIALDQLLVALAVVPYQGVLVGLLEKAFFGEELQPGNPPKYEACLFAPKGTKAGEFSVSKFDAFRKGKSIFKKPEEWKEFAVDPKNVTEKDQKEIRKLFDEFLLPFTRGAWARKASSVQEIRGKTDDRPDKDIYGFAIPAYDEYCPGKGWRGGMTGWLVVFLKDPQAVRHFYENCAGEPEKQKLLLDNSWKHFTDLVRTYVRRVREANIRDLLEDYAEPDGTHEQPRQYFLKHLHQVIGFKALSSTQPGKVEPEVESKHLVIPEDTHREKVEQNVLQLPHTCWNGCGEPGNGTTFPPGTRRLCAMFLDELELVRAKREEGQDAALAGFFHQIRNLGASASETWLMKGTDAFRVNVENSFKDKYADLPGTCWRIIPFSELHRAFGITLGVWGRTEVFTSRSNLVTDLITGAVEAALACVTTMAFKGAGVEISDDRKAVREKINVLAQAGDHLKASLLGSLGSSPTLDFVTEEIELAGAFKKLLVRLAEETLCHGELDTASIHFTVHEETCDLKWHNDTRPGEPNDDLHRKLASYAIKATSQGPEVHGYKRGSQVNKKLVERMGGTLKTNFRAGQTKQCFLAEGLRLKLVIH